MKYFPLIPTDIKITEEKPVPKEFNVQANKLWTLNEKLRTALPKVPAELSPYINQRIKLVQNLVNTIQDNFGYNIFDIKDSTSLSVTEPLKYDSSVLAVIESLNQAMEESDEFAYRGVQGENPLDVNSWQKN